eukprot:jgi/Botrbrau1/19965/Bobra.0059s0081.1
MPSQGPPWRRLCRLLPTCTGIKPPGRRGAGMFPAVITSLSGCMATRYTSFQEGLWRAAVPAFTTVVSAGLPAINIAYINGDELPPDHCWSALAEAFEIFLLGSHLEAAEAAADPDAPREYIGEPGGRPPDPGMVSSELGGGASRRATSESEGEPAGAAPRAPTREAGGPPGASAGDLQRPQGSEGAPASGAATPPENDQSRVDADLEASVLDTLTDAVLTACVRTPHDIRRRLVGVVERGVGRPRALAIPRSAAGTRFGQLCLRKMFVLCSRGVDAQGPHACLLEVAQVTFPLFVETCRGMLEEHAQEVGRGREQADRTRFDDFLCMLDALATLTVSPLVADSILPPGTPLQVLVEKRRKLVGKTAGRHQTHLLVLYEPLCSCLVSQEPRVRALLQDIFQLAGAQLGLLQSSSAADVDGSATPPFSSAGSGSRPTSRG